MKENFILTCLRAVRFIPLHCFNLAVPLFQADRNLFFKGLNPLNIFKNSVLLRILYWSEHAPHLLSPCRCVLGNTTILAEFASEEEISRFFAQGQSLATPSSGWQAIGSSQSRMDQSHPFPSRASEPNQWNSGDLHRSSLWGGPNYSSSLWGNPGGTEPGRISSPSPISSFLPVDHLTGAGDSM